VERQVLAVRDEHPSWGGRKIHHRLKNLGVASVPAASTITAILHRHGRISGEDSLKHRALLRFERAVPNELWQMDFKGEFRMTDGRWCYPLTILDDHSRYSLLLRACGNQQRTTVQQQLQAVFRRYGLPKAMLMDNGSPWGVTHSPGRFTRLTAWLLRLDVRVLHGRPYHPQTQGKEERFHRTLATEVLRGRHFDDLPHVQSRFDPWREVYNHQRPHEALEMRVPSDRYRVSLREYPEPLPAIEYASDLQVRKVNPVGQIRFQGRTFKISEAFGGEAIGLRATPQDGVWKLFYCHQEIGQLNLESGTVSRRT
jgi:transposase InsO family protein